MKTFKKLISKIPHSRTIFTGIWTIPLTFICTVSILRSWGGDLTVVGYLLAALYALLGCAVITGIHTYQYAVWGKHEFTLRSALHNRDLPSRRKIDASHPAVPEKYLSLVPSGYILGRTGQKYVRILPSQESFCALVCSSPGAGKSVTMMASLLGNYCSPHRSFLTIATDPKGELSEKFADLPDVKIVSLTDREKCGYNPFFWYTPSMSDEEMQPYLKTMAEALVSDSGGERNAYFWANARKILIGLLAWLIRKGKTFPEAMTAMYLRAIVLLMHLFSGKLRLTHSTEHAFLASPSRAKETQTFERDSGKRGMKVKIYDKSAQLSAKGISTSENYLRYEVTLKSPSKVRGKLDTNSLWKLSDSILEQCFSDLFTDYWQPQYQKWKKESQKFLQQSLLKRYKAGSHTWSRDIILEIYDDELRTGLPQMLALGALLQELSILPFPRPQDKYNAKKSLSSACRSITSVYQRDDDIRMQELILKLFHSQTA